MFTNFSPIRHVNDVEGTYFVKKINIYLIKIVLCSPQDIHELKNLCCQPPTLSGITRDGVSCEFSNNGKDLVEFKINSPIPITVFLVYCSPQLKTSQICLYVY